MEDPQWSRREPRERDGKARGVGEPGGEPINDGLIAESQGQFDSAEYERQLKHGVDAGRGD